jgi:Xaa-Pro aminopeptidase
VIHDQEHFSRELSALSENTDSVQIDQTTAAAAIVQKLSYSNADIVNASDPCKLPKACKNETELNGIRKSHLRDGVAESRFLHWLATIAQDGNKDEIEAADQLETFRREGEHFRDLSFDTISGSGPNGAIVHYRVTPETNRKLGQGELYLVDSGAQYLDGTTDITRTIAIGSPSDEMRDRFTSVLKGHIAIARAVFPEGTSGGALDILARQELWRAGLDYDHGTGHGVGCYLGVHEGPQSISKVYNSQALLPGMIISNEPGYYKTGEYGIRIENLVAVREARDISGGERKMLSLETLTFAPIDLNLVLPDLLTEAETDWLNDYHQAVWDKLAGDLPDDTCAWLKDATRSI